MESNRTNQTRNVRVRYEPGDHGLALSIYDELDESLTEPDASLEASNPVNEDAGVLTVVKTGITTLELQPRGGSGPSVLIWDEAEVDWATVQAS